MTESNTNHKEINLEQIKQRFVNSSRKIPTAYSPDLGKLYPSPIRTSRATQLSLRNRLLAHKLAINICKHNYREHLSYEEINEIVILPNNSILPIQSTLMRTSSEHRIWMRNFVEGRAFTFVKTKTKPQDYVGPRLPENWDTDSLFLGEGVYDIWSSKFYAQMLEQCKKTGTKPDFLSYVFSDAEFIVNENQDYIEKLQIELGLVSTDTNSEDTEDTKDFDVEEIEEYDIEEDFQPNSTSSIIPQEPIEDVTLRNELLLRHTSLTSITQKVIAFIQDECYNNCSLYLLYSALDIQYTMTEIIEESVRLKTPLVILFNQEIFVAPDEPNTKIKDKPLFKSRVYK